MPILSSAGVPARVETLGGVVDVAICGSGSPMVVLPRENIPVNPELIDKLSQRFTVHIPVHPGYGGAAPEQWEWLRSVRDLATVYGSVLDRLDLGPAHLVGLGIGGWVAAELAVMAPQRLRSLALISPMGMRPDQGKIFDQFLVNTEAYARAAFHNDRLFERVFPEITYDLLEEWETAREMSSRITWKPYMYNPVLPRFLRSVGVPALVLAGENDPIVPGSTFEIYGASLPGARLVTLPNRGHVLDYECPDNVLQAILDLVAE